MFLFNVCRLGTEYFVKNLSKKKNVPFIHKYTKYWILFLIMISLKVLNYFCFMVKNHFLNNQNSMIT